MKPIVVVGSINMDLVTQVPRIPRAGETLIGSAFQTYSGGKGANQAVGVARLDYPAVLLGAVGDDVFGTALLDSLRTNGVDMSHVLVAAGASGVASIAVDTGGENSITVVSGANAAVTPQYLKSRLHVLRGAAMVLAQLEIPLESVAWLAECCAELQVPLMLDPAPASALPDSLLRQLTWFTPNETEAEFYAGGHGNTAALPSRLLSMGTANVLLKRSGAGAVVHSRQHEPLHVTPFRVDVVDTTAAGDAFNAAFAVALCRHLPVAEAARYASAAAAISVTRAGAQTSLATQDEVASMLAKQPSSGMP